MNFQYFLPMAMNSMLVLMMCYGVWTRSRNWFLWPVCFWGFAIFINQSMYYFSTESVPFNPGEDPVSLLIIGFCGLMQAILAWPVKQYPTTGNQEGQNMVFKIAVSHIWMNIGFAILAFNMTSQMSETTSTTFIGWTHVAAACTFVWAWMQLKNGANWKNVTQ